MKKIAILAFAKPSDGGIFQYTLSLIEALKSSKNECVLFCKEDESNYNFLNLEIRKIPNLSKLEKIFMFQGLIFNRKNFFKHSELFFDIDILISPFVTPYVYFTNKPYIVTIHDMQERYFPKFFSFKERFIRYINKKRLAQNSEFILCESNYVKNDIIKFLNISQQKIKVLPSPPTNKFLEFKYNEKKAKEVIKKYNLPNKYIFYPAQYWYHKNHLNLIRAFNLLSKKYPELYLIFTGAKKDNFFYLEKEIKKLNLEDKVFHLGYVDYEDLPYLYKLSLMLVMPSLFESISIPVYEAFSLKVPVCCSNVVALPEQVGDAALLFNPYSVEDIAEKIETYLKDEHLMESKALKGFEKIKNFDFMSYKINLISILEEAYENKHNNSSL